jgi:hypothetical protein
MEAMIRQGTTALEKHPLAPSGRLGASSDVLTRWRVSSINLFIHVVSIAQIEQMSCAALTTRRSGVLLDGLALAIEGIVLELRPRVPLAHESLLVAEDGPSHHWRPQLSG